MECECARLRARFSALWDPDTGVLGHKSIDYITSVSASAEGCFVGGAELVSSRLACDVLEYLSSGASKQNLVTGEKSLFFLHEDGVNEYGHEREGHRATGAGGSGDSVKGEGDAIPSAADAVRSGSGASQEENSSSSSSSSSNSNSHGSGNEYERTYARHRASLKSTLNLLAEDKRTLDYKSLNLAHIHAAFSKAQALDSLLERLQKRYRSEDSATAINTATTASATATATLTASTDSVDIKDGVNLEGDHPAFNLPADVRAGVQALFVLHSTRRAFLLGDWAAVRAFALEAGAVPMYAPQRSNINYADANANNGYNININSSSSGGAGTGVEKWQRQALTDGVGQELDQGALKGSELMGSLPLQNSQNSQNSQNGYSKTVAAELAILDVDQEDAHPTAEAGRGLVVSFPRAQPELAMAVTHAENYLLLLTLEHALDHSVPRPNLATLTRAGASTGTVGQGQGQPGGGLSSLRPLNRNMNINKVDPSPNPVFSGGLGRAGDINNRVRHAKEVLLSHYKGVQQSLDYLHSAIRACHHIGTHTDRAKVLLNACVFLRDIRAQQLAGCFSFTASGLGQKQQKQQGKDNAHADPSLDVWAYLWQGGASGVESVESASAMARQHHQYSDDVAMKNMVPTQWDYKRTREVLVTAELAAVGQEHVTRSMREHLAAAKVELHVHALLAQFGVAVKGERLLFSRQLLCLSDALKNLKSDNGEGEDINKAGRSTTVAPFRGSGKEKEQLQEKEKQKAQANNDAIPKLKLDELLDQALELNQSITKRDTSNPPTWAPLLPLLITLLNKLCEVRVQARKCLASTTAATSTSTSTTSTGSNPHIYHLKGDKAKAARTLWSTLKTLGHALKSELNSFVRTARDVFPPLGSSDTPGMRGLGSEQFTRVNGVNGVSGGHRLSLAQRATATASNSSISSISSISGIYSIYKSANANFNGDGNVNGSASTTNTPLDGSGSSSAAPAIVTPALLGLPLALYKCSQSIYEDVRLESQQLDRHFHCLELEMEVSNSLLSFAVTAEMVDKGVLWIQVSLGLGLNLRKRVCSLYCRCLLLCGVLH